MNKRIFTGILVIMVIVMSFVACSKELTVTDSFGKTHVILTDKQGNSLRNEQGFLYEEIEDSDGSTFTQIVEFPGVINNGKYIENNFIKIQIPNGWIFDEYLTVLRINHKDDQSFSCHIGGESTYGIDFEEKYKKTLSDMKQLSGALGSECEESTVKLHGVEAKKISYYVENPDDDNSKWITYLFEKSNVVFKFDVTLNENCIDEINVEEIINSFELKI